MNLSQMPYLRSMSRVEKVIRFLNLHINEQLSIDDIAHEACLSSTQLYREFKQHTGLTPTQYHEQLKVKESLSLLAEARSVSHVAYDLGYRNYETFSRAFKKISSVSPSDFLWTLSFIRAQPGHNNYILVKEDASLAEIRLLTNEYHRSIDQSEDTLIYRISPGIKSRPEIIRCTRSEELIRPYLA